MWRHLARAVVRVCSREVALAAAEHRLGAVRTLVTLPAISHHAVAPPWRHHHHTEQHLRHRSTGGESLESQVDTINDLFVEARDEIEYAKEDSETTYFNESVQTAREAVGKVLGAWEALLQRLPEGERGRLQRSMGMKMEQLKAEMKELEELHA